MILTSYPTELFRTAAVAPFGGRPQDSRFSLSAAGEVLDNEREVPEGLWYKRFFRHDSLRSGKLIKTFLLPGQARKASVFLESSLRAAARLDAENRMMEFRSVELPVSY